MTALIPNFDLLATAPGGVARLRELILTLAVKGKLVPQDLADEPASVLLQKIRAEKDRLIAAGVIKREKPQLPIEDEDLRLNLPDRWEWARLEELSHAIVDCPHSTPRFVGDGYLCIDTNSFKEGRLLEKKLRYVDEATFHNRNARLQPQPGDLVFAREGSVGESVIIPEGVISCLGQRVMLFRFSRLMSNQFIRLTLTSKDFLGALLSLHKGIGAKHVNVGDMRTAVIPVPPFDQQIRIVTRVEELMRLCDALESQRQLETAQHAQLLSTLLGTLTASTSADELAANWQRVSDHFDLLLDGPEAVDALEQTILQLAVRGLLVPQDPNDEPASVLLRKIRAEKDQLIAEGKIKRDKPLAALTDEETPFDLPGGWRWARFDDLINPMKPVAYGVLVPGAEVADGIPFVRIADLSITSPAVKPEKTISPEVDAQFQRTRLDGGEILMGVVGSIGKLGIAPQSWAGANIARAVCRIVPVSEIRTDFVLQLLESAFMQKNFSGDTRTLAQPTLNVGLIRGAPTPVPPLAEQTRIVARVKQLRRLCADLRQRLAARQKTQRHLAEALVAV